MTDTNGTCEYVLDPDDPETWRGKKDDVCYVDDFLNDNHVWRCPHDAVEDEDVCIFHLDVDKKNDKKAVDELLSHISESVEQNGQENINKKTQFIGAKFGEFDITANPMPSGSVAEINLQHATFTDRVDFAGCELNHRLHLEGAQFLRADSIDSTRNEDTGSASFFVPAVSFTDTNFRKEIRMEGITVEPGITFRDAEFQGQISLEDAEFNARVSFENAHFRKSVSFDRTTFDENVSFGRVNSDAGISFMSCQFCGRATFTNASLRNALFSSMGYREINEALLEHNLGDDTSAEFSKAPYFAGADLANAEFFDCSLVFANFSSTDLTEATLVATDLRRANLESALLNRATLFEADLRGARLSGTLLGDIRINDSTRLLGNPSRDGQEHAGLSSVVINSQYCVYDPRYEDDQFVTDHREYVEVEAKTGDIVETKINDLTDNDKAKSVYRQLTEVARDAAQPRLQSACFVRRQDLQKYGYKQDAKEADSWQERLIAGTRYSRAKVARGTLMYGESPWRVIGGSIGFIILVSLFYPLGEWLRPAGGEAITYGRIFGGEWSLLLESLYFSTLTFTTLGMGDYEPMGFGQVLATLNTALGAVLIALLVFVLGRRAAR